MSGPFYPNYTKLDAAQIIRQCFDENTDRLRVDASLTVGAITLDAIVIRDAVNANNKLKVNADGSLDVNTIISHLDDSIRLGDGTNFFTSTTVGPKVGLDVSIINGIVTTKDSTVSKNVYNEILSVANGSPTQILSFTATADSKLMNIHVGGTNIAEYTIELNTVVIAKRHTYFGNPLDNQFDFADGLKLLSGDNVKVKVVHSRPQVGDFNANLVYTEL